MIYVFLNESVVTGHRHSTQCSKDELSAVNTYEVCLSLCIFISTDYFN